MDNNIFNVNGESKEDLKKALELAHSIMGHNPVGWKDTKSHGVMIYWAKEEQCNRFMSKNISIEALTEHLWDWLQSIDYKDYEYGDFESDYGDSDVISDEGWRVFTEDWGHVKESSRAYLAVKPAYTWYGK